MSRFLGSLKLRALTLDELRASGSDVQLWELIEPFGFESAAGSVTVPAGFTSDFASVPRLARFYVDDDDPVILGGSIVHDYVYSRRGILEDRRMTREDADGLLREAMLASGAREGQAFVVYCAVRIGGASHWES